VPCCGCQCVLPFLFWKDFARLVLGPPSDDDVNFKWPSHADGRCKGNCMFADRAFRIFFDCYLSKYRYL